MFPSGNCGIDPLSPSFPLSTSFLSDENLIFPPNPNFIENNFPSFVEPFSNGLNVKNFTLSYESDLPVEIPRKKKDMPRKIITAKGPRERRVRLSLNVARKFFDLQDMLGFDKASKTLDWLLGNSDQAIEELKMVNNRFVISKSGYAESAYATTYEYEDLSDQSNEDSKHLSSEFIRYGRSCTSSFRLVGKESRSKARERARKRTKEKMVTSRACNKMHLSSSCPSLNQIKAPYSETMMSNCSINEQDCFCTINQAQRTCTTEDSVFINRSLLKPFSTTNTASSSIDYQNWETIGMFAPQSFCYVQNSPPETEFRNC